MSMVTTTTAYATVIDDTNAQMVAAVATAETMAPGQLMGLLTKLHGISAAAQGGMNKFKDEVKAVKDYGR